jgi:nucleotide-binding universal stress UspA family protein
MKTILFPTNFSNASKNALEYAISIAQKTDAKIVVLHAYMLPSVHGQPVSVGFNHLPEEIKATLMTRLDSICGYISRFKTASGKTINVQYSIQYDSVEQEISTLAKLHKADLIVMGSSNPDPKVRFGSTVQAMIGKTEVPILVIHEDTPFRPIQKIDVAIEEEWPEVKASIERVTDFAALLNADITLLHVEGYPKTFPGFDVPSDVDKAIAHRDFVRKISNYERVHYKTIASELVEDGLQRGVKEDQSDLLVLIYNKRSWLDALFHKSVIKNVLNHFRLPVLILNADRSS